MVSANNRVLTYDVRHGYGDWTKTKSVDHLDPYLGFVTHRPVGMTGWHRNKVRQVGRALGLAAH